MFIQHTTNFAWKKSTKVILADPELLFLFYKYLSNSNLTSAAAALEEEIHKHRLVPDGMRWTGMKYTQTLQEYVLLVKSGAKDDTHRFRIVA
jgi:hypothetical protein